MLGVGSLKIPMAIKAVKPQGEKHVNVSLNTSNSAGRMPKTVGEKGWDGFALLRINTDKKFIR
ncbi:hypothetical protein SAMN05421579_1217 [Xenorhabdus japonica]|uniref:Uncharacterized protein n=1 Tax=Xenorhabdus japonica TaxID=53341 RepID=A0A1I5BQM3_9GAMM|nr:hypothetical protein SAMN05421579_1217 [Xenorhabdus japonica]